MEIYGWLIFIAVLFFCFGVWFGDLMASMEHRRRIRELRHENETIKRELQRHRRDRAAEAARLRDFEGDCV